MTEFCYYKQKAHRNLSIYRTVTDRGNYSAILRHMDQLLLDYAGDVCPSVSGTSSSSRLWSSESLCYQFAALLSPCFNGV
jgi:hypothetical protein